MIIVDSREPAIVPSLLKLMGFKYKRMAMEFGDFTDTRGRIIIERKSIDDLLNSAEDGRLWIQLNKMVEHSVHRSILVIHGRASSRPSWGWSKIVGLIASLSIRYPIQVIWLPDLRSAVLFTAKAIEKAEEGKIGRPRPAPISSDLLIRLSRFLGIPIPVCDRLLTQFETVERISGASEEELMKIRGIGHRYAKQILKRLREALR